MKNMGGRNDAEIKAFMEKHGAAGLPSVMVEMLEDQFDHQQFEACVS